MSIQPYQLFQATVPRYVRLASTANIAGTYNATGGTSGRGQLTAMSNANIDGVAIAANNRILLKNQTNQDRNGVWIITTLGAGANGVWDRDTDWDGDVDVLPGIQIYVAEGTVNNGTFWALTNSAPITVGGNSGSNLTFTQIPVVGGGGGANPAVTSVFARTGAVVAAANDYSVAQLSGLPVTQAQGGTGADLHLAAALSYLRQNAGQTAFEARTPSQASSDIIGGILTTLGDLAYWGAGVLARLAGDTSNNRKFLRSQSAGGVAAAPAWDSLVAGDIPSLDASKIGTGQVAPSRGGTGFDASVIAKGGMLSGTGAGTMGITTVGADGTVWTADAASAGGAKWAAAGGGSTIYVLSASDAAWAGHVGKNSMLVWAYGGGGGGGSGGRKADDSIVPGGGSGGGGACRMENIFRVSDLAATLNISIGAGGTGGAGVSVDGSGNAGANGGNTTISSSGTQILFAPGALGGGKGFNTNTPSDPPGKSFPSITGLPQINATDRFAGGVGGQGSIGNSDSGIGLSSWLGAGGGGGGGYNTANGGNGNGGNGWATHGGIGGYGMDSTQTAAAGDAGTQTAGTSATAHAISTIPGGGGGGGDGSATVSRNGGNGVRGGGGGGGGAARGAINSGSGGNGGNGFVIIIVW